MRYLIFALLLCTAAHADTTRWPSFRGDGTSISTAQNVPVNWAEDKNIAWSIDTPGYGQSSPVIWDGRVFVTSIEGDMKQMLHVTAVNLADGKTAWRKTFTGTQGVKDSDYVTKGSPTPAVDANGVYAFFESGDVIALSRDGEKKWHRSLVKDYGQFEGNHGVGSSLAQTKAHVIVLIDHAGECYLAALDKKTGETAWRTKRTQRVSWTSPIVTKGKAGERIVVSSNGTVEEFDAKTGERLWLVEGLDGNTVPSATVIDERVYIGSSKPDNNLAIKRGGEGDVTATHVAWRADRATTTFCSPLVIGHRYYTVNRAGVAFCVDARTGKPLWQQRVGDSCWASPTAAEGRVYFFGKNGATVVTEEADEFKLIAQNELPTTDRVYGVAVVDGHLVIRTGSKLIAVSADSPELRR